MQRVAAALVLALAVVVGGMAAVPAPAAADAGGGFGALQTGGVDPDTVVLTADVQPDGDAAWTIEYRVRLDDDNTTAAFESLQSDIRANRSAYANQFETRMGSTVAAAENATGRQMALENVSVSAEIRSIPQDWGVVTYRFTWTGFAATSGDRLVVGDALAGFFLDGETRLTVTWPTGYEVREVAPPADDRSTTSVTWTGPKDFGGDEPRLVLAEAGPLPVSTPVAAGAAAGVLLVLLGAVLLWRRRGGAGVPTPAGTGGGGSGSGSGSRSRSASGASGTAAGGGADTAAEEPPDELLSPEERVLKLLRSRGGRMKQKEITDELDWSAARTSQVVGDLRDAGEVETFRIGRENVLRIPDEDDEEMP